MRKMKAFLELEKIVLLNMKENEDIELKINIMIDEIIENDKKNNGYLSSFKIYERKIECIEEEYLVFTIVKKAIDSFDPYFVHPESYDEYDGESERIAEKIKNGMSIDEIAEIMKEEFNWSFSATFTREDFVDTAKTVFNLLKDCFSDLYINDIETGRKEYVYIKLLLYKEIFIKEVDEDVELTTIEMIFDKISLYKDLKFSLSSFNISNIYAIEI